MNVHYNTIAIFEAKYLKMHITKQVGESQSYRQKVKRTNIQ